MQETNKFTVFNIREYLSGQNAELGEDDLHQVLSEFSCEKNSDVERFFKEQSIEFARKHQSVTYLVFSTDDAQLLMFYQTNGFQKFASRQTKGADKQHELVQLLKIL